MINTTVSLQGWKQLGGLCENKGKGRASSGERPTAERWAQQGAARLNPGASSLLIRRKPRSSHEGLFASNTLRKQELARGLAAVTNVGPHFALPAPSEKPGEEQAE